MSVRNNSQELGGGKRTQKTFNKLQIPSGPEAAAAALVLEDPPLLGKSWAGALPQIRTDWLLLGGSDGWKSRLLSSLADDAAEEVRWRSEMMVL